MGRFSLLKSANSAFVQFLKITFLAVQFKGLVSPEPYSTLLASLHYNIYLLLFVYVGENLKTRRET